MIIKGSDLGKKYGRTWIFRNLDILIPSGGTVAITGSNGSGKSTLLKILSGFLTPSEGFITHNEEKPDFDNFHPLCFSAPYIEVPEEMTFGEFLKFHARFRKQQFSNEEVGKRAILPLDKRISEFSTGMKQRVQLSTAFYFKNEAIFMDEPTSNLDEQGFEWWKSELKSLRNTTFLIASNQKNEINECNEVFTL
ncbi:MAG: ATP-binding cassette domain-containing protein [Cyclobacteriaceae bacterium]